MTRLPAPVSDQLSFPLRAVGLFVLAVFACTIASAISNGSNAGLLIWPAAAFSLVAAYRSGLAAMLPVALATSIWALVFYRSLPIALWSLLICTIGPGLAAGIWRRFDDWKPIDDALDRFVRFLFVTLLIAAPISASLAVLGAGLFGDSIHFGASVQASGYLWLHWWLIEACAYLLISPALMVWWGIGALETLSTPELSAQESARRAQPFEFSYFGLVLCLAIACFSLAFSALDIPFLALGVMFLFFPLMMGLALKESTVRLSNTLLLGGLTLLISRATQMRIDPHGSAQLGPVSMHSALDATLVVFFAVICALVLHSVAFDRKQAIVKIARQAREDLSTGLLNDRGLMKELDDILGSNRAGTCGLIEIRLSNFDSLSDLCGNHQSQNLERIIAKMLRAQPKSILAARISAGRYALLLDCQTVVQVRDIARELFTKITEQRFHTENGNLRIQAAIGGLVIDPAMLVTADECMSALADTLTIAASVREPQLFIEPLSQTMIDARRSHQTQVELVRDAIAEKRVEIFAQPIHPMNPSLDQGIEFEVLCRLRTRDGRLMQTPEFIPLTALAQMSVALDKVVIEKTFEWLGRHPQFLASTHKCSINLSGLTLSDSGIASFIFSQRVLHDIPADKIIFEITESEAIRNPASASRLVDQLKAEGFSISLDDFGTGLATFEYLKRFSIDYLKIDGSFVRTLQANSIDEEIVRATIRIARHLKVITVAEHVHQPAILELLRRLGVDAIQGALVGMPVPLKEIFQKQVVAV